jgi:hypothetical protein
MNSIQYFTKKLKYIDFCLVLILYNFQDSLFFLVLCARFFIFELFAWETRAFRGFSFETAV